MTSWGLKTREHTFASGETAILRDGLPLMVLVRKAAAAGDDDIIARIAEMQEGKLSDAAAAVRIQDLIVQAMFVEPRVIDAEAKPNPKAKVEEIPLDWLPDEVIEETIALALGGVADAESFRGDGDGATDSGDGEGLGDPS